MSSVRSLRRLLLLAGVTLLIVLLTGSAALAAKPPSPGNGNGHGGGGGGSTPTPTPGPKVVCLDPGHGGSDPGAVYGGLQEKDLTLQIAGILSEQLTNQGYTVAMTRTTDVSMTNTQRAEACNAANANAVVSIHLNATTSSDTIDYFQAFWGKKNKDLAFAQTITGNYTLSSVEGSGNIDIQNVGQFASGVLLKSNAPATLAETVFLSDTKEQIALADGIAAYNNTGSWSGTRQEAIASALDAGIVKWLAAH